MPPLPSIFTSHLVVLLFLHQLLICLSTKMCICCSLGSAESESGIIRFRYHSGEMLEKCMEYFYYFNRWNGSMGEHPEFTVDPKITLAFLSTASTLEA